LLFKNVGAAAGASLEHIHSQLIALPLIPPLVLAELEEVAAYRRHHDRCVYCDMIQSEQDSQQRVVIDAPSYIAFCPHAGRFAYETWVVPKTHTAHFDAIDSDEALDLASTLREVIARLEAVLQRPAYNYTLHTTPFDTNRPEDYHWHIKLMPRIAKIAGLELATGVHINTVAPERAAEALRLVRGFA
jgi:UDPglucose--hexose-1-phosphate uridylyltransferase